MIGYWPGRSFFDLTKLSNKRILLLAQLAEVLPKFELMVLVLSFRFFAHMRFDIHIFIIESSIFAANICEWKCRKYSMCRLDFIHITHKTWCCVNERFSTQRILKKHMKSEWVIISREMNYESVAKKEINNLHECWKNWIKWWKPTFPNHWKISLKFSWFSIQ